MVTIQGEVFFTDNKDIHSKKTGKDYVKIAFDMTDRTNSVRVSKFLAADKAGDTASKIKKGLYCTVQGKMVYDTFAKEMVLEPTGIVKAKKPERRDTYEGMKRVELHLHTNMSAMDGMSSTASLLCRAAKWGHRAMAITDHGVAQAFPEALHAQEGKQKDTIGDMKIIYGIEAYYINDENSISVVRGRSAEPLDGTFIVFDLETTGLNPASEEITEIAAVRVVEGEIRDSFQTYVNPHKPIPAEITELTGISDETVADAPDLDKAVPEFLAWAGEGQYPLVAHNAGFDMGFLRTACQRLGIEREFTSIDTLEMSRLMLPHMHKFKLNILAKELQVVRAPPRERGCRRARPHLRQAAEKAQGGDARGYDCGYQSGAGGDDRPQEQDEKPAALSFYHSGEEPGGAAQPVSADFQELSGILQQAPHYAAQRTHPSP